MNRKYFVTVKTRALVKTVALLLSLALCLSFTTLITVAAEATNVTDLRFEIANAVPGETIALNAEVYELEAPLYIPDGVSLQGDSGTIIQASATNFTRDEIAITGGLRYPIIITAGDTTISDLTVKGPASNYIDGILALGGELTLLNVIITDIHKVAVVDGMQIGTAVSTDTGDINLTIKDSTISNFNKNGIYYKGSGTLTVTDSVITGIGETDITAQNGILVGGGTAVITGNTISEFEYEDYGLTEWNRQALAIDIWNDAVAIITNNTFSHDDYGVLIEEDEVGNALVINNSFSDIFHDNIVADSIGGGAVYTDDDAYDSYDNDDIYPVVTAASITRPIVIAIGNEILLEYTITPSAAEAASSLAWKSSDNGVISVDVDGKITVVTAGIATITLTITPDISFLTSDQLEEFAVETELLLTVVDWQSLLPSETTEQSEESEQSGDFVDVKKSDWFHDDVAYVVNRNLFTGTSDTSFSPDLPMTRGMFVTVLGRYYNVNVSGYGGVSFDDVSISQYYAPYIKWAAENGIVKGYGNGLFKPDDPVTRQDMAVIFARFAAFAGYQLNEVRSIKQFADARLVNDYAVNAVNLLYAAGLINGKDANRFDPLGRSTRAEVAAVLHRFINAVE
ncbi:MAG: S-layer homology domain-containing protein [Oscillospiraceae bacterium]|jgi:hypothetical protein|nr:S-layer homology domain-containing protein [Oscillospiraceae bacterium]